MTKTNKTPQRRGPKPRPIDTEKAYELARDGADLKEIAESQNRVNAPKFGQLMKKHEELGKAIKLGREEIKQEHETRAIPAATKALLAMLNDPSHPGHTAATLFVHKTMLGYREGVKHEHSGQVDHVHSLSPEDRQRRIEELRKELESTIDVEVSDDADRT